MNVWTLATTVTLLLLLSGCGQKGPLLLPGNPDEVRSRVPSTDVSQDETGDEDEEQPLQ